MWYSVGMKTIALTQEEYEENLEAKGYDLIDEGSFGIVFSHPTKDTVLKVFANDAPYLAFIKRVHKMNNPYFPEISKIEHFKSSQEPSTFTVVEMEELTAITDLSIKEQDEIINRFGEYVYADEYIDSNYSDTSVLEFDTAVREYRGGNDTKLLGAFKILCDLENTIHPCKLDCHGANVMIRKEGKVNRLVFTDPLWSMDWCGGR